MTEPFKKYKYKVSQLVSYWEYFEVEADTDEEAIDLTNNSNVELAYKEFHSAEETIIDEREINCKLTKMLIDYDPIDNTTKQVKDEA